MVSFHTLAAKVLRAMLVLIPMRNSEQEFERVSRTALPHAFFRTFYGIPYAKEIATLTNAQKGTKELYGKGTHADLIALMEARYKGGEAMLDELIKENDNTQVLELGSGLSLHGIVLAQRYPSIQYVETDYSDELVLLKEKIITEKILKSALPNLHFTPANALNMQSLNQATTSLKQSSLLLVYHEGLAVYLTRTERKILLDNIKTLLRRFDGAWVTPDPAMSVEHRRKLERIAPSFTAAMKRAEVITGRKYSEHGFESEREADEFFRGNGFLIQKYPWPTNLNSFRNLDMDQTVIKQLSEDIKNNGKVWVLRIDSK